MSPRLLTAAAAVCVLASIACAGPKPPVIKTDYDIVDGFTYSAAEAGKIWKPMTGSTAVSVVEIDGRRALKMPCHFKGTDIERASWDRDLQLDLAARSGLTFLMRCRNPRPVGHFSFYFRSGNGWYAAGFSPPAGNWWKPVRIRKWDTRVEGSPAGWSRIDGIRISAWRGRDEDTEFHIAALGLLGSPGEARIVVVRAEAGAVRSEARTIDQCVQRMSRMLEALGLPHVILSDRDVTPQRLKGKDVVLLPYNPITPDRAAGCLVDFVKAQGKVLAFYVLPRGLQEVVGIRPGPHVQQTYRGHFASIRPADKPLPGMPEAVGQLSWNIHDAQPLSPEARVAAWWFDDKGRTTGKPAIVVSPSCVFLTHILLPDDPDRKARMLLAMVGQLCPKVWAEAARSRLAQLGRLGPYENFDAAMADLRAKAAQNTEASALLDKVAALRDQARKLHGQSKFPQAIAAADRAHKGVRRAYCRVQKPQAGEHRAFWCHSALGVQGMSWDQAVKNLADNGFTAVLPNMLWGGVAYYESHVLPVAPDVKEKGDQIALCAAACKKYGVACHVWKVNFNIGWRAPKDFVARMKAQGRTQVGPDLKPLPRQTWLCPSHPDNQKLEIASMVEVARKYDVAGVHFDYIRYPGNQGCYCAGCRKRFEEQIARGVARWPGDLRKDRALRKQWLDFRRRQITAVVAAVAEQARKARPGIKISAAVFRNWPTDRDTVGQDWKLWCDRGYLDFVCPMDYTPDSWAFQRMVRDQLEWAGKVPCYPGIGVSVWPDPTDIVKLIEQITVTRRLGTGGFTIFNYAGTEAAHVVPLCGLGITRKKRK